MVNRKQLLKDLAEKYDVELPDFIFTDDYEIFGVQDRPLIKIFKFNIIRTHEVMLGEDEDPGNEQRGQITESSVIADKYKKKWDGVVYSQCVGKNVGGPLLGWIKNHNSLFYSNGRHRKILGARVITDDYIITNDDINYGDLFTGNWEIKGISFSEWPDEIKESYLNQLITSEVNVYYSDSITDYTNPLERKSFDFIVENDNVSDLQKIHALECPLNEYIKLHFGYRFSKYLRELGILSVEKTFNYLQIRSSCPLTILSDYKLKAVQGRTKGYDKFTNRRELNRSPWADKNFFLELKGYEIGIETFLIFDNLYYNNNLFINLSWGDDEFYTMVKKCKITKAKWNRYKKLAGRFSDFYRRLQDINNCLYKSKQKLFKNNLNDIRFMWRIFLEFEKRGKFFDIDVESGTKRKVQNGVEIVEVINDTINEYEFGLENEIVKLLSVFRKVYGKIGNKEEDNLWAHKRTFGTEKNQEKTIKLFFDTFFTGEIEFNEVDDNNKVKKLGDWKLDLSNYINWDYKFQDPIRKFDDEIQSDSYHNNNEMCMITRKKVYHNLLQGHHKIYHEYGGISEDENCWMILSELNNSKIFKSNLRTSDSIRQLIKEQPEIFEDGVIEMWENGGLAMLEEEEQNIDFYYFPSEIEL